MLRDRPAAPRTADTACCSPANDPPPVGDGSSQAPRYAPAAGTAGGADVRLPVIDVVDVVGALVDLLLETLVDVLVDVDGLEFVVVVAPQPAIPPPARTSTRRTPPRVAPRMPAVLRLRTGCGTNTWRCLHTPAPAAVRPPVTDTRPGGPSWVRQ